MRETRTYTEYWDVQTYQHELLGMDLGEGIPRTTLRYGAAIFAIWWALCLLLVGAPSQPILVPLFIIPPGLITLVGSRRSTVYWRRTNLQMWAVRAVFLLTGVRPLIGRGRITPPRGGLRLRARRLGEKAPHLATMPGFGPAFAQPATDTPLPVPPVKVRPRVRLYGPDHIGRLRGSARAPRRKKES
ncbi:hypothetical protein AB0N09_30905 [Streptomyces erythrochromogenes]|uniref:hypothetical protein n=1 Tax=Streptomyces erythrochromogenes TaxID=285574 RepID=UPI0034409591